MPPKFTHVPYLSFGGEISNETVTNPTNPVTVPLNTEPVEFTATINDPSSVKSVRRLIMDTLAESTKICYTPEHIFHNRKTAETIVIWKDGSKTIVKPMDGMPDSEMSHYAAFTAALAKKIFGSNTQVNKIVGMTTEPVKRQKKNGNSD